MCNGNSTPAPVFSTTTPTIDIQAWMENYLSQLQRERDMMLAWVDERERALGIEPRTAEIRKWWRERRE
jgi:hypothetical protein